MTFQFSSFHLLRIIKKQDDLIPLFEVLLENRPPMIQGYHLEYSTSSNHIHLTDLVRYGGYFQQLDWEWAWKNRGLINDWIRGIHQYRASLLSD
jgi:hypothetical protein